MIVICIEAGVWEELRLPTAVKAATRPDRLSIEAGTPRVSPLPSSVDAVRPQIGPVQNVRWQEKSS